MSVILEMLGFVLGTLGHIVFLTLYLSENHTWINYIRSGGFLNPYISLTSILGLLSCLLLIINLCFVSRETWKRRVLLLIKFLVSVVSMGSVGI